jgi:nicotinamide mononucleotide adenylyltransferase
MNYLVVYPGRFQPLHKGHLASYQHLVGKFGAENVYIATSDVQAPVTSPFSYSEKTMMASKLGVPASHIVRVKNPYQAQEITQSAPDPDNTVLIFALSEKDMSADAPRFKFGTKKDGTASYMQPYPADGKKLKPMTKHAYVYITPTVDFKVRGVNANSASEIRKLYADGSEADRMGIINDLYGSADQHLKDIFDRKLAVAQQTYAIANQAKKKIADKNILPESVDRVRQMLARVKQLEEIAKLAYQPLNEDLVPDYLEERSK